MCLALSFAFAALSPCKAFADDVDYSLTYQPFVVYSSSDSWSSATFYSNHYWYRRSMAINTETATADMNYGISNLSGQISTTTLGGKWLYYTNDYLAGRYTNPIKGNMKITGYVSNTEPLMIGDFSTKTVRNGYIYTAMSYYGGYTESIQNYAPYIAHKGDRFRIQYTPRTLGTCEDVYGKDFTEIRNVITNYSLWYKHSGGSTPVKVEPDSKGIYVMPEDAIYVAVCFRITNTDSLKDYIVIDSPNLILLDDSVNQVVNNQTQNLMKTDGSSDIAPNAVEQGQQIVQGVDFVQQTGQLVTGTFDAFNTASATEGVPFPGLTIMGYSIIPAQNVPVTGYLGADVEDRIRDGVTLVLFLAWIMGLRSIYHRLFLGEVEVDVVEE